MKPKLIIINGPLGSGKTTLARAYADDHPLTLRLDIDNIWALISGRRDEPQATTALAKNMANAMAEIHLQAAHDVVVPQFYFDIEQYIEWEDLAKKCNAELYEVYLEISKKDSIDRYIKRGQAAGNPDGFRPGSLVKRLGGIAQLEKMYDQAKATADARPKTIRLNSRLNAIEETYSELLKALESVNRYVA